MSKKKPNLSGDKKLAILREHLINKTPISEICEKHQITPSSFYRWQQELFTNATDCFTSAKQSKTKQENKRINKLETQLDKVNQKLSQRNEVLSELMSDHIALKKSLGEI